MLLKFVGSDIVVPCAGKIACVACHEDDLHHAMVSGTLGLAFHGGKATSCPAQCEHIASRSPWLTICRPSSADPFRLPDYRNHKYSDSHSSLASFATSRSEAHSRISSVTTINEIPSIDSVLSEVSRADASSPGLPASSPTQAERRAKLKSHDASLSPRGRSRTGFIVPRITRAASPSDVALNMKQGAGVKPPSSATMST